MKKKVIALLLVASMTVACLVGCGDTGDSSASGSGKTTGSEEATGSNQAAVSENENFNATGYPVVNEPVTLTVMGPTDTARGTSWEENTAWAELAEICGVEFEFIEVAMGEWEEELSLTLASGELPDIILNGFDSTSLADNIKAGNIIDLAPYIEAYGENIKYYMENMDTFTETVTLPTGEIASLPFTNMTTETGKCPASMFYFYQPWMDKLDLEIPTTADELYDVLVAIKNGDPNGNGQADEIPFLPRNLNNMYELFGLFGIIVQQNSYLQAVDDEIVFTPTMQNFKDGVAYIAKLYQEGLMNPDVFTDGNSETLAKGGGETAIAGSTIAGAAFATVGEERNDDMTLAPYIAADGYEMAWLNRNTFSAGKFVITKDCEYPEVALRVWDYMFSEEGAKLMWMGPEENYTYAEDGTWTWNLAEGQTTEQIRAVGTIQPSISMAAAYPTEWFKQAAGSETKANEDRYLLGTEYADYLRRAIPDALQYDSAVSDERALLLTDLNSYVNTSLAQFITGELDIEKDWDAFMSQCENLKVDEIVEMTQASYDTYLGK